MGKPCSRCKQNSYIETNGRWYCEKCGNVESLPTVDENAELRAKLAAAEKTISTLAEQMISDADYTAKLLDKNLDASAMASGKMAIKAIEELKKGR